MPSDPDPDPQIALLWLIMILLGLSAMFAASEIGLLAVGRLRARQLADAGSRTAKLMVRLLDDPGRLLSTIIFSITALLYTSETLTTMGSIGRGWGLWVPMALIPVLIVTFVEVTPVLYASQHPERVALITTPLVRLASTLLYPIVFLTTRVTRGMVRLAGGMPGANEPTMTEEEIKTAIVVAEEEGLIEREQREMLHGVLEFTDKTVREVMAPRVDIVSVPASASLDEVLEVIVREKHSRIPVYRDTIDDIVGVIYAKDIVPYLRRGEQQVTADQVARPPYFIPVTKKVDALLDELQRNRRLMAIVVGKEGGTSGLVTVEDLLEEIVGDILDEYDVSETEWERIEENVFLVNANLSVRRANRLLGIRLPGSGYETIAGLVLEHTKSLPTEGQLVGVGDLQLIVAATQGQRIERVRIVRAPQPSLSIEEEVTTG